LSLFGAWDSDFFETSDEVRQGFDFEHFDLREWEKGSETIPLLYLLREKQRNAGQNQEQKRKKLKILVS